MVEKRIVTKNRDGEVVKIIEHHDLRAEKNRLGKLIVSAILFGLVIGILITTSVVLYFIRF